VAAELLEIIVSPKSSRSELVVDERGSIRAYLNSPPVDGRANEECVALLSRVLGVPRSGIFIRKGQKGRKKLVAVTGMTPDQIVMKIREGV
jgi:uncharacterized protein